MPNHEPLGSNQADIDAVGRIAVLPTILDVVCRMTGMGFAAVARVTKDRWVACGVQDGIAFGLKPGGELKIETTICNEIRDHRSIVVIDDVATDKVYCNHHTPATYGFRSYISVPIELPDGSFFGTLCAIDPKPHTLSTPETVGTFKLFAELISHHLQIHLRIATTEATLSAEKAGSVLREQFIAVLGHDLRNPLASIAAGARMLEQHPERTAEITAHINRSVSRMSGLIDNVLDFARGRLGGGMTIMGEDGVLIEPALAQVVQELRINHPDQTIETDFAISRAIRCDAVRIAQLLSNLLGNALTHGDPAQPVRVKAAITPGGFELAVSNGGEPIPPAAMENLFQPFFRGAARPSQEGLGLGLFIASEIAKAHGGQLDVSSTRDETRFTFRMPVLNQEEPNDGQEKESSRQLSQTE